MAGNANHRGEIPSLVFPIMPEQKQAPAEPRSDKRSGHNASSTSSARDPQEMQAMQVPAPVSNAEFVDTGWSIQPLNFSKNAPQPAWETAERPRTQAAEDVTPLFDKIPPAYPPRKPIEQGDSKQHSTSQHVSSRPSTQQEAAHQHASQDARYGDLSYMNDEEFASILEGTAQRYHSRQSKPTKSHSHKAQRGHDTKRTVKIALGSVVALGVLMLVIALANLIW